MKTLFLILFINLFISLKSQFKLLDSKKTKITFSNNVKETAIQKYAYAYNGAGLAIADFNNDNLPDIFFISNLEENKLYINYGDFVFKDMTKKFRLLKNEGMTFGVSTVDINSDGFLDIYICKVDFENELWVNVGGEYFVEQSEIYGINDKGSSIQSVFFDIENDGDLDLIITAEATPGKKSDIHSSKLKIYINNNSFYTLDKTFYLDLYGLGIAVSDIDKNGFEDIYISNDLDIPDYLFMNYNGKLVESFKDRFSKSSLNSMGCDIQDFDNDTDLDLIILDMSYSDNARSKVMMNSMNVNEFNNKKNNNSYPTYTHNMFQINDGFNNFSEQSHINNITSTDWAWGVLANDFNNDGLKDIFITNGIKYDITNLDAFEKFPSNKVANFYFERTKNGEYIQSQRKFFDSIKSFSNGVAYADLDLDGDLDLVINNVDDEAFVLENRSTINNYLRVKINGSQNNTLGIGAKVNLYVKENNYYQEFQVVRGYLSSVEPILHFGLGEENNIDSLKIRYLSGKEQILYNIPSNQILVLDEKNATFKKATTLTNKKKYTQRDIVNIKHEENEYNDFKEEILLPKKLSSLGPSIEIMDLNNDGLDDFVLGSSLGTKTKIALQEDGTFFEYLIPSTEKFEDGGIAFLDLNNDGKMDIYIASGGNENRDDSEKNLIDRVYLNNGKGLDYCADCLVLKNPYNSNSCVKTIDIDQDGDLDLFVGGRQTPGKYPEPTSSFFLINENGKLIDKTTEYTQDFQNLGMVTDAIFSDYDNDGDKDLIVVGEWMPVTIFNNNDNKFTKLNLLKETVGWWNCIEEYSNNNNEKQYLLGNLGLNHKFNKQNLEMYYSDFDNDNKYDIVLAKTLKNNVKVPVRGKQCSTAQMPFISSKFTTYTDFAHSNLEDIYSKEKLDNSMHFKINTFESSLLTVNLGQFSISSLPKEVQISQINDFIITDVNNDEINDAVIVGNYYDFEPETSNQSAFTGEILLGKNNSKKFEFLNSFNSGFSYKGDARNIREITIKNKKFFVVSFNNSFLKFYEVNK